MELESIKNEEKFMNLIMFWTNIMIPLVAYAFVMLFLNGERKDAIVLIMVAAAVVTKICERWLGKYAKYIYGCIIPVVGAVTIAFADGGHFIAMTHGYFMVTVMMIPYYNLSLILVNALSTIGVNLVAMLLFPKGYTAMHPVVGWVFITAVYVLLAIICMIVSDCTRKMFYNIREGELDTTVDIFKTMLVSSENIIKITGMLQDELNGVAILKDRLLDAMKEVEEASQNSVETTTEISASTEEQVAGIEEIVSNMDKMKMAVDELNSLLKQHNKE